MPAIRTPCRRTGATTASASRTACAGSASRGATRLGGAEPDPEVLAHVARAVERLAALGAAVEDVGPVFDPLAPLFTDYWLAGFAHRYRSIPEDKRDLMDPRLRALATQGLEVNLERYYACVTGRARLTAQVNALFTRFDLLVTPTTPVTAPPVETAYHSPEFDRWRHGAPYTVPFNLTGHPGGSAPCGVTGAGLPVGVQIVGARFDEPRVLRAMRALESADPLGVATSEDSRRRSRPSASPRSPSERTG